MDRKTQGLLVAALAGSAFVACSVAVHQSASSQSDGDKLGMNAGVDDATDAGADAARRVCPDNRLPDGGWVKVDGIDTSDYEFADWDAVKANNPTVEFSFLRVSAALVRTDTRFGADWPEVQRVGLLRGAYQYLSPRFSAIDQANLFLQRLHDVGGLLPTDLPPVLDLETTNDLPSDAVTCKAKVWLAKIEDALLRVPMIYTPWNFGPMMTPDMTRYPLWVPNYVGTPSQTCPRMPDPWQRWDIWQYGGGTVSGIYSNGDRDGGGGIQLDDAGAPVVAVSDLNYFNGTRADLDALIANSVSQGGIPDPPRPANPPHVHSPVADGTVDCSDGCCIIDP